MSIANLMVSNSYDLFCRSIQSTGDIYNTVTKDVRVFSNTNVDIFGSTIQLKYVVRNGICFMWFPTTSTATLPTNNLNYTSLYIAESAGGYVTIPCTYTNGEKLFFPIVVLTQGSGLTLTGKVEVDCNVGGDGNGRLTITLDGNVNVTGGDGSSGTPWTYALQTGSNLFNRFVGIYGFSLSYPVEGLV